MSATSADGSGHDVAASLAQVRARIAQACARAGRPVDSVELIAVSKLQPESALREAYAAGQRLFGENYAQELRDKAAALESLPGIAFHAIGPLQKNKAKYVVRAAQVFHALSDLELARELSAKRTGPPLGVLLQIHLGDEATKSGIAPAEAPALLEQVRALPNLEVRGLMSLPPLGETAEASRPYFQQLRALARSLGVSGLSMGTTFDFEVAIEEGATWVRVGTAIFGERAPRT